MSRIGEVDERSAWAWGEAWARSFSCSSMFFWAETRASSCRAFRRSQVSESAPISPTGNRGRSPAAKFITIVLGETEDTWRQVFSEMGRTYEYPKLVLFTETVESRAASPRRRWALLLRGEPQGLYRSELLPGAEGAIRSARGLRAGLLIVTRWDITSRTFWEFPRGRARRRTRAAVSRKPARVREDGAASRLHAGVWANRTEKSRRILEPGGRGRGAPRRELDRRRPHPDADTRVLAPDRSRMEAPSSASDGSAAVSKAATCRRAIPSARAAVSEPVHASPGLTLAHPRGRPAMSALARPGRLCVGPPATGSP